MRLVLLVLGLAVLISLVFILKKNTTYEDTIKIGFIAPLTGDASMYGEAQKNVNVLAVEKINRAGGINGRLLNVIYEDGKCSGKEALTAAQKLVNVNKVKIIIGGMCSSEVLGMEPFTEQNKVIIFSPMASSPEISKIGEFIFRNIPVDDSAAKALANKIINSYNIVGIISENTEYALTLRQHFIEAFTKLGGLIVFDETFLPESRDFRAILTKLKGMKAEALFVNPQTDVTGALIIKQARELGINLPLFGSALIASQRAFELVGSKYHGFFADAPSLNFDNPRVQELFKEYESRFGPPPGFTFWLAAAYDAVVILTEAISKVGLDTEKIRDYLYSIRDFEGLIGKYGFNQNGDVEGIEYVVKEITN